MVRKLFKTRPLGDQTTADGDKQKLTMENVF